MLVETKSELTDQDLEGNYLKPLDCPINRMLRRTIKGNISVGSGDVWVWFDDGETPETETIPFTTGLRQLSYEISTWQEGRGPKPTLRKLIVPIPSEFLKG
jgi:hypothetical protein